MFKSKGSDGRHAVQITFSNGYTVSVIWGYGAYCNTRNVHAKDSENAEVACWGPDGKFVNLGNDDVRGWQTPEEVLRFMNKVQAIDPANPPASIKEW